MIIWCHKTFSHVHGFPVCSKLLWIWSCTVPILYAGLFFFSPKAATLHLNLMVAKIKIRGVSVFRATWQRCVTFRERERERGGGAGGMDSCSKADCAGWLSYQGSSHASKSQIKHPHLSFHPAAALLQVPAPSLPPCVTVPSVDYQLWSKAGALTGSEQNGEVGTWGISCCYHFVSGRWHFHGRIHMQLRYAFLSLPLFVQVCARALCRMVCGLLWLCVCCVWG